MWPAAGVCSADPGRCWGPQSCGVGAVALLCVDTGLWMAAAAAWSLKAARARLGWQPPPLSRTHKQNGVGCACCCCCCPGSRPGPSPGHCALLHALPGSVRPVCRLCLRLTAGVSRPLPAGLPPNEFQLTRSPSLPGLSLPPLIRSRALMQSREGRRARLRRPQWRRPVRTGQPISPAVSPRPSRMSTALPATRRPLPLLPPPRVCVEGKGALDCGIR